MKREIVDTIKKYDTIIIHRHVRPDPDAYGSQMGLQAILQATYPEKTVYTTGEHEESLAFLGKPEIVADDMFENALVIVTDTANTERVDDQRYNTGEFLIKIDHHPNDDAYGDLLWVNTSASSCSEMIYDLFTEGKEVADWKMDEKAARFLFAGIVGDTGRFIYPSTTETTFNTVGELIKYNFNRTELFDGMYELSRELLHMQGYIFQNFVMDDNGAAYIKLPIDVLEQFGVTASDTSLLVGSLGNVKGIKAWVIFVEEADQIRVRLRSKGPIINTLAKQYNGGGHPMASGATIYNWEESKVVIAKLKELCAQY
ncbi:bifunctional oligoribonuclease/PAP phosphatase NrnA [Viridibacillus sp. YIM B01967]|uniref:Bifunctional oligoribonuclease/PAP phosphatase NrnA n=1 Tax=Viridibacillus soli TaxID=2798301 RepID=A0ABS1H2E4_9BACL|nr:bifunctional oligoribonuclease/PAP phosphatase NrnA [Viridibacillus soli]MBK3493583.1 bifunctional oligoribonuclease/PAP phosphatase NrnA [Viridibacillus soli]